MTYNPNGHHYDGQDAGITQHNHGQQSYGQEAYGQESYGQESYAMPAVSPQPSFGAPKAPENKLAIAALVVGGLALLTLAVVEWLSLLLGIAAIVLGVMGLRKTKAIKAATPVGQPVNTRKGFAIGGIVLGVLATIISAFVLLVYAWVFNECGQYWGDDAAMTACTEDLLRNTVNG